MAFARTTLSVLLLIAIAQVAVSVDVRIAFFDNTGQSGDAASYTVSVTNACTSCQGFGVRLTRSFESYLLAAPTSNSGNYSVTLYDGNFCETSNDYSTLTTPWADFPGSLKDSVDSWKICPPGVSATG